MGRMRDFRPVGTSGGIKVNRTDLQVYFGSNISSKCSAASKMVAWGDINAVILVLAQAVRFGVAQTFVSCNKSHANALTMQ